MNLEKKIGYKFKKKNLLLESITHKSYGNENGKPDNERLEFLGDSIIGLIVAKYLYTLFPDHDEGDLSKLKNQIVSSKSFCKIAKKLDLGTFMLLGRGELKSGGRKRESNLAGLFEAIVGALYLDSGPRATEIFLNKFLLNQDFSKIIDEDYKSILQIISQKQFGSVPKYQIDKEVGRPHDKKFYVSVFINDIKQSSAIGKSKKIAQNNCAMKTLKKLKNL